MGAGLAGEGGSVGDSAAPGGGRAERDGAPARQLLTRLLANKVPFHVLHYTVMTTSRKKGRYASPSPSSTTLTEAGGGHVARHFSRHHAHKHAHNFGHPYILPGGS